MASFSSEIMEHQGLVQAQLKREKVRKMRLLGPGWTGNNPNVLCLSLKSLNLPGEDARGHRGRVEAPGLPDRELSLEHIHVGIPL
jgi:hypothetical protein